MASISVLFAEKRMAIHTVVVWFKTGISNVSTAIPHPIESYGSIANLQ